MKEKIQRIRDKSQQRDSLQLSNKENIDINIPNCFPKEKASCQKKASANSIWQGISSCRRLTETNGRSRKGLATPMASFQYTPSPGRAKKAEIATRESLGPEDFTKTTEELQAKAKLLGENISEIFRKKRTLGKDSPMEAVKGLQNLVPSTGLQGPLSYRVAQQQGLFSVPRALSKTEAESSKSEVIHHKVESLQKKNQVEEILLTLLEEHRQQSKDHEMVETKERNSMKDKLHFIDRAIQGIQKVYSNQEVQNLIANQKERNASPINRSGDFVDISKELKAKSALANLPFKCNTKKVETSVDNISAFPKPGDISSTRSAKSVTFKGDILARKSSSTSALASKIGLGQRHSHSHQSAFSFDKLEKPDKVDTLFRQNGIKDLKKVPTKRYTDIISDIDSMRLKINKFAAGGK